MANSLQESRFYLARWDAKQTQPAFKILVIRAPVAMLFIISTYHQIGIARYRYTSRDAAVHAIRARLDHPRP